MDLSIEEIESMAEASEGHMPLRCSILRVTETVNEAGNRVRVYSMIATNIPCDLTAIQQREGMMGGAIMMSSLSTSRHASPGLRNENRRYGTDEVQSLYASESCNH
jgi:hypothetical protein